MDDLVYHYLDVMDELGLDRAARGRGIVRRLDRRRTRRGSAREYFGHSINPTRSRARFNEAHDLIIKAWTSDELFQWSSGPNYEYRYVNIWPRPLQQPHPPVYIPGAGNTETMKFCAERPLHLHVRLRAAARVVRRWFDGYRQAAAELGYVPDPEKIAFLFPCTSRTPTSGRTARPGRPWSGCSTGAQVPPRSTILPGTCRRRRCAAC